MPEKHVHKASSQCDDAARVSNSYLTQKKRDWIMVRKWLNKLRNDLVANLTANWGTGVRKALAHSPFGFEQQPEKLSMGGAEEAEY
jgi:hypothetical protein